VAGRGGFRHRHLDLLGEHRLERDLALRGQFDKALRQIGVLGSQRRLDLALRQSAVERAVERAVGDGGRLVLDQQKRLGVDAARHDKGSQCRQQRSRDQCRRDAAMAHCGQAWWREALGVPHARPTFSSYGIAASPMTLA
jgi:hypothetical protein